MNTPSDYIYILRMENTDYYRVGVTNINGMKDRFRVLQMGNPNKLIQVYGREYINYRARDFESIVHKKLSPKKQMGDWFKLEREELEVITNYLDMFI